MNDKEKEDFEILKKQVEEMQLLLIDLNSNKRNYTQNDVFNSRVTFRGEVYDKSGTKVIN